MVKQSTELIIFSIYLVATVDLVVVGGNNAVCTGASVTLQCMLMGDTITCITPEGALNFLRGRQNNSKAGSYQGQLLELNETYLRSTLIFNFTPQVTINCSDMTAMNQYSLYGRYRTLLCIKEVVSVHYNMQVHQVPQIAH